MLRLLHHDQPVRRLVARAGFFYGEFSGLIIRILPQYMKIF